MTEVDKPYRSQKIPALDSIRGIAAMLVVLHHCRLLFPYDALNYYGYFHNALNSTTSFALYSADKLFSAGHAAVLLFFVLSGFVLAVSLEKKHTPYGSYLIKRFFRIYPVFIVVTLAVYAAYLLIGSPYPLVSEWIQDLVNQDLSLEMLAQNLVMVGTDRTSHLDVVSWSLAHEVRASILFPLILLSVERYGFKSVLGYWAASLLCMIMALIVYWQVVVGYNATTFLQSMMATLFFLVFFALGAYGAVRRDALCKRISSAPRLVIWLLFLFVFVSIFKSEYGKPSIFACLLDYARGIGGVILILLALSVRRFSNMLNHILPVWLGRVSYSLYLIHVPIIYVVTQTFGHAWPPLVLGIVCIAISLLCAELLVRGVELPFMSLGKHIAAKFLPPRSDATV